MSDKNELQKTDQPNQITLDGGMTLNLDGLPEETVVELRKKQSSSCCNSSHN